MSFPPDIGLEIGANVLLIRSAAAPWKDQEAVVRGDDVANAEQRIIHGYIGGNLLFLGHARRLALDTSGALLGR